MPSRKFSFKENSKEITIEVSWKFFWKNIEVKINNEIVHRITSKKELDKGAVFHHLGIKYLVQMKQIMMSPQLIVEVNDRPTSGSSNDPVTMVRNGYYMIFFLTALNIIVGLMAILGNLPFLINLGFGFYNVFAAIVYLVSYFISKKYNLLAGLTGGFLFYILDGIVAIVGIVRTSPNSITGTVIMRIMFGTILFLACKGAYKLQGKIVSHAEVNLK